MATITLNHLLGKEELPKVVPIPQEELRSLITRAQAGDLKARDQVIMSHLRFASKQIRKMVPPGAAAQELLVAAAYGHPPGENGLIRAVAKFDQTKAGFTTYAAHWIRAAVQAALRAEAPATRSAWRVAKAKRTRARLEALRGSEVTDAEVAAAAKVSPGVIEDSRIRHVPLDESTADDDDERDAFEELQNRSGKDLHPLGAEIVRMRFFEDASDEMIGERLGIRRDEVLRLEKAALALLRKQLRRGDEIRL